MKEEDIERLYYYNKQYLGFKDFQDEQKYHRDMRRRHNLAHHSWGVVVGLELVEISRAGDDARIDVYVHPGIAVDGFGREIIVLQPFKLDPYLFDSFTSLEHHAVWIAYDEKLVRQPHGGYKLCDVPDQFQRVQESFRIIVEDRTPDDPVIVAGKKVTPAASTDTGDLIVPTDESIPYQEFQDNDSIPRWLIRLGSVKWDGVNRKFLGAVSGRLREGRQYVGNITAEVLAPEKELKIRHRFTKSPLEANENGVEVNLEGSLTIDRLVTANNDVHILGKVGIGTTNPQYDLDVPSGWFRFGPGGDSGRIFAEYGSQNAPILKLSDYDDPPRIQFQAIGSGNESNPQYSSWIGMAKGNSNNLAIMNGDVGIGTTNAKGKLQIDGSAANAKIKFGGSGGDVHHISSQRDIVFNSNNTGTSPAFVFRQTDFEDLSQHKNLLWILGNGNVGIGTTSPGAPLHVAKYMAVGPFSATPGEGGIDVTGSVAELGFVKRTLTAWPGNPAPGDRFVWYNPDGTARLWTHRLGDLITVSSSGSMGIGTTNAKGKLQIDGSAANAKIKFGGSGGDVHHISSQRDIVFNSNNTGTSPAFVFRQTDFEDLSQYTNLMWILGNGNVGIGTPNPSTRLHIKGSKNADASNVTAHIALIENTSTGASADVLALKVGKSPPRDGNNFISFFAANNLVGSIEGLGTGTGIRLKSGSGDYAECLPRLREDEIIDEGDLVGVFGGKISRFTENAHHVMAVTTNPIVVGNAPDREKDHLFGKVAFLGQVPVKVRGAVREGDYIIPSGMNDGTGVAVSPFDLTPDQSDQIVGKAWENSNEDDVKLIKTAVGFHSGFFGAGTAPLIQAQQQQIDTLKREVEKLKAALELDPALAHENQKQEKSL